MAAPAEPGHSPGFKKPPALLRLKRKRPGRRSDPATAAAEAAAAPAPRGSAAARRRNPFSSLDNAPRRAAAAPQPPAAAPAGGDPSAAPFWQFLEPACEEKPPGREEPAESSDTLALSQDLHSPVAAPRAPSSPREEFPADWSIKTRVLFMSSQPFAWAEHLKAQEEAQGFAQHCRAAEPPLPQSVQEPRLCTELRCAFQQSLVYWVHPSLPWLPLFPRLGADRRMAGKACPWAQDEALQQVLMSEWEPAPSDDDDDGSFSWLEEMGVQDKVKKPDTISIQLRKEKHEVQVDHRPESLVLVRGSNTFTLLNFLISCRSLVAVAGPQAGLPPTLLSPVAFRGGTMQTLKARTVSGRARVQGGFEDMFSLEVLGPVLPHALHALTLVLGPAQRGAFRALLSPHEPSAAFNTRPAPAQEDVQQDLPACGLHPKTLDQLRQCPTLGKASIRLLEMKDYTYTWKA
ncbi:protein downstream neighbor of Son isoform X2 [Anomalospiza imberbis]|uniref:protein downstream neighbor of Son isoform X2 n=1 Tax=Anomalospiza imberbis TaxID=187417 RepID=UPI00358FD11F